jgi:hypothetical protein
MMTDQNKPTPEQLKEFVRVVVTTRNLEAFKPQRKRWDDHNHTHAQDFLPIVQQYINGLITDYEFLIAMHNYAYQRKIPNIGEFDRNTGLRYTPDQVMRYAGITGKVGFDGLE